MKHVVFADLSLYKGEDFLWSFLLPSSVVDWCGQKEIRKPFIIRLSRLYDLRLPKGYDYAEMGLSAVLYRNGLTFQDNLSRRVRAPAYDLSETTIKATLCDCNRSQSGACPLIPKSHPHRFDRRYHGTTEIRYDAFL